MNDSCTSDRHAQMKADATQWGLCTPPVDRWGKPKSDVLVIEGDDEEPGYVVQMRNCPHCGSTLAVEFYGAAATALVQGERVPAVAANALDVQP